MRFRDLSHTYSFYEHLQVSQHASYTAAVSDETPILGLPNSLIASANYATTRILSSSLLRPALGKDRNVSPRLSTRYFLVLQHIAMLS